MGGRTCRSMLERLRMKRNNTKSQAAARNGRVKNDTRPTDASLRGGSSSRSNSTGKDAEPIKDLAPGQPQQHSPAGAAPTDSCEGVESITALATGIAVPPLLNTASSAATATATSFPSHAITQNPQQQQGVALDFGTPLQYRERQAVLLQGQGGDCDPRVVSLPACAPRGPMDALPPGGGNLSERQLYISQGAGPGQQPNRILAGGSSAAQFRSSRIAEYDIGDRRDVPDSRPPMQQYRDAPYGRSTGVDGSIGWSSSSGGSLSAAALAGMVPRRPAPPQPEPAQRPSERDVHRQLGNGGREDPLLLQLAMMTRGPPDRVGVPKHEQQALDLGPPPLPVNPVLNLGRRVDLSLELQLQDIYREEDPLLRSLSSGAPLGHPNSSNTVTSTAALLPQDPLLPLGHRAAAPLPQPSAGHAAIRFGHQQPPMMGTAASALLGPQQQQQQRNQQCNQQCQQAFSDLSTALRLAAVDGMNVDTDHMRLQTSLAARNAQAPAPSGSAACDGAFAAGAVSDGIYGSMYGGGSSAAMAMAAIPEAADSSLVRWSSNDIDAALDMLMEEAGSGAVYHTGNNTASLERICFKLNNLHPQDLPPDLMGAMGSWLAAARTEVVQGAVRPGCIMLVLDVYVNGPDPADELMEEGSDGGDTANDDGRDGAGGSDAATSFSLGDPLQSGDSSTGLAGGKGRVLGGLVLSGHDLAHLEAAAAAAGGEVLQPIPDLAYGSSPLNVVGNQGGISSEASTAHLSAYVMHRGNVRAATACYKKLLGPRAVQSMAVSIRHEVLTISSPARGRYVTDVRGTMAGLDTPLLLSVSPLAVVAGTRQEDNGRAVCAVEVRRLCVTVAQDSAAAATAGNAGGAAAAGGTFCDGDAFQKVSPYDLPALMGQLLASTLPGSHRAEAVAECTNVNLAFNAPDAGLLMVEWEADCSNGSGGISLSEWLPLLSVPDIAMASEINELERARDGNDKRQVCSHATLQTCVTAWVRPFLDDLGLVLDYVTRISHGLLMPISTLMTTGEDASGEDAAGGGSDVGGGRGGGDGGGGGAATLPSSGDFASWQSRSGGGGADQRSSPATAEGLPDSSGGVNPFRLEHDSRTELMTKPRLSKRHYNRVAALTPALLAFAADSGMLAVMSWLMDFMLEHVYFGDLAAVFQSVESVGDGAMVLPLLHRTVRSGKPDAVQLLLHRAASHNMACNLAQPADILGCCQAAPTNKTAEALPQGKGELENSSHSESTAMALRAAAEAVVTVTADRTTSRDSASGSASATAYNSWASEEPTDASVIAAGTAVPAAAAASFTGRTLSAAEAPTPPLPTVAAAVGYERRDGVGSDEAGAGMGDSAEEFRERQEFRRRGGRLADLGAEAVMETMTAPEDAAPRAVRSDLGSAVVRGGRADMTAEAPAAAAAQPRVGTTQQGNGWAPLQVLTRIKEGCSGAATMLTWLRARGPSTAGAAAAPAESGSGLSGPLPSAGYGLQSVAAATTADSHSVQTSPKANAALKTSSCGDSTEDWVKMKLSMHAREEKQQDATVQQRTEPRRGGRAAGGSGSGGVHGNGGGEGDDLQGQERGLKLGKWSLTAGNSGAASAAPREAKGAVGFAFREVVGFVVSTAAATAAARAAWLPDAVRGAAAARVGRGEGLDGRFLGRPMLVTLLMSAIAVAVGVIVALVSRFAGQDSLVDS
ncbi:hypothetical protein VOLCADRAFT_96760 [Volvox carteri f. nagariensis]|uniref:Uncharacterized protein n=1 Tax=Volvox carteri f. nagariensis TaxID=3068 RepID=D8UAZ3_VOLCA|nr:uncharacterized protein VOLCADRAFT_96760 [Volvox carteri f. nagariensis]EFJ43079.1 hypothetical protein VOLCADRAFT_96760 [Volvox carteri f. nagariensis]|eukprot:XP_002955878.1 hypothetical protein VOLCADRAFT_96760 [Volvox carteri f. nagariensis]